MFLALYGCLTFQKILTCIVLEKLHADSCAPVSFLNKKLSVFSPPSLMGFIPGSGVSVY